MFLNKRSLSLFVIFAILGSIYLTGCGKKKNPSKLDEKCSKTSDCVKGLYCRRSVCADLSMQGKECKYLKTAIRGVVDGSPKSLIKGVVHKINLDTITSISKQAGMINKMVHKKLTEKECAKAVECGLSALGVGYAWFWTRAAFGANSTIPTGGISIPKNPVKIISVIQKRGGMGEDDKEFPAEKIKMMQVHRVGCKSVVKFRLREKFSGFVTFHYWRKTGCEVIPPEKGKKDAQLSWKCKGEAVMNHPYYTQTVYLYPFSDERIKLMKKAAKAKGGKKKSFMTGNPGTYSLDVWAYNPIDPKLMTMHKQFEGKELEAAKAASEFITCPAYQNDPFNDGCACIGFVPSKITVTTSPDPFHLAYNYEKCDTQPAEKPKK
jgi:hypothetical protein